MSIQGDYNDIKNALKDAFGTASMYLLGVADEDVPLPLMILSPLNSYEDTLNSRRREWAITLYTEPQGESFATFVDGVQAVLSRNLEQQGEVEYGVKLAEDNITSERFFAEWTVVI